MRSNVTKDVYIDRSNNPISVANFFTNYFKDVYFDSPCDPEAVNEYNTALQLSEHDTLDLCDINASIVDVSIHKLKVGKAVEPDGLSAEHLLYAHPSVTVHLSLLFNNMLSHCFVPHDFGVGFVVPIIKDKLGNVNDVNNYRGITLVSVLTKVF